MDHILDNPIWNALISGNAHLAEGNNKAKYLKRDIGAFAGLQDNSKADLICLHQSSPPESLMVLFVPAEITIPAEWVVLIKKPLLQMLYPHQQAPFPKAALRDLGEKDVEAMLSLTALTEPGPFLRRTIEFGNYQGIFAGEQLVAMAGQRLQPGPFIEISAVCTHPDHTGKGYAALLVSNQIHTILERSSVPFLHLEPGNQAAFQLYHKLGFQIKKEILCYVLKKP